MNRRSFLVAGAATAVAPVFAGLAARAQVTHQFGEGWFTNSLVETHEGRTVRFYDDLLKGKVALINLMFTQCADVCPGTTQNLAYVQEMLGERVGREIAMFSITIDPVTDTPERLAAYAKTFGVGPGWLFLRGDKEVTETLRVRLGFKDSDPVQDADILEHVGTVRIGNEPLHRWSMSNAMSNPAAIVRAVERVMPV